MRRLAQFVCVVLLAVPGGCAREAPERIHGTDAFNEPFPTFAHAPERVVSLAPSTTEIIFALGQEARLVGRSRWDTWPAAAAGIQELGDGIRPNIERVLAARPDLVLLYAARDNEAAAAALRAAQVPVVALRIDRISDYLDALTYVGTVLGVDTHARALRDSLTTALERVRAAASERPHPTVFVHVWSNPLMTIGRTSFLSELLEIAGGRNLYGDLDVPSAPVSPEDVVARNPDIILGGAKALSQVRANPAWQHVHAVETGHLFTLDTALFSQPSMRLGRAAAVLADLLHGKPK